jgi:hypothetical protein
MKCKSCGEGDFGGLSPLYDNGLCPCCNLKKSIKKSIPGEGKMRRIFNILFSSKECNDG